MPCQSIEVPYGPGDLLVERRPVPRGLGYPRQCLYTSNTIDVINRQISLLVPSFINRFPHYEGLRVPFFFVQSRHKMVFQSVENSTAKTTGSLSNSYLCVCFGLLAHLFRVLQIDLSRNFIGDLKTANKDSNFIGSLMSEERARRTPGVVLSLLVYIGTRAYLSKSRCSISINLCIVSTPLE